MTHQILRAQREINPAAVQPDTPVPGTVEQFVSQHAANICHNFGCARRVKAVAAVICPNARKFKAAGITPDRFPSFD